MFLQTGSRARHQPNWTTTDVGSCDGYGLRCEARAGDNEAVEDTAQLAAVLRKAVALKLADHSHDDGTRIFPSVATIAAQTEISERAVQPRLSQA